MPSEPLVSCPFCPSVAALFASQEVWRVCLRPCGLWWWFHFLSRFSALGSGSHRLYCVPISLPPPVCLRHHILEAHVARAFSDTRTPVGLLYSPVLGAHWGPQTTLSMLLIARGTCVHLFLYFLFPGFSVSCGHWCGPRRPEPQGRMSRTPRTPVKALC